MQPLARSIARLLSISVAVAGAVQCGEHSLEAADRSWSASPGSQKWSEGNWTPGQTPGAPSITLSTGDALSFGPSTITSLLNDNSGFSYAGLTFNADSSAFTISGNAFTLTGGITNHSSNLQRLNTAMTLGATQTIQTNAGTVSLNGVISGTGFGLIKTGAGLLNLMAANTYTGGTIIQGGTIGIFQDNNLGASASMLTLDGGMLKVVGGGFTNTHAITVTSNGGTIANAGFSFIAGATLGSGGSGMLNLTGPSAGSTGYAGNVVNGLGNYGNFVFNGTNAFAGTINVASGANLEYATSTALAAATINVNSGGRVEASTAVTVSNNLTVADGGSLGFQNANTGVFSGTITLSGGVANVHMFDWYNYATARGGTISGKLTGTGGLNVFAIGGATLTASGANDYSGATTLTNVGLTVSGANGTIGGSAGVSLQNSTLTLDYSTANLNKLKDTATVSLGNNSFLALTPNAGTDTAETLRGLSLGTGAGTVSIASAANRVTTLAADTFSRGANLATALVRGTNLNQSVTTNVSRLTLGDGGASLVLIGTNTLSNGATNDTTLALKIVPYLLGDISPTGTGSNFVTHDSTLGLRVLQTGEQTTLSAGYVTAANHDNAIAAAVTLANGSVALNSLLFNSAVALNGTATTLTIDSGAIASTTGAASIGSGVTSLSLANGEGVLLVGAGTLTINAPISVIGGGGLTKGGAGAVTLTAANSYTGQTTVNQGTLTASSSNNIFNGSTGTAFQVNHAATFAIGATTQTITSLGLAGTAAITGTNGTLNLGGDIVYDGAKNLGAANVSVTNLNLNGTRTVAVADSAATISVSTTNLSAPDLIISSAIADGNTASGLTKTGTGTAVLSGANTYTGTTKIDGGTLVLGNNGTTGTIASAGAIVNNGTLGFSYGSGTLTQGTGFSSSPITGTGGLTNFGAGTVVLTAANSFSGPVRILNGTVSLANLGNAGASSNLGGNGTIYVGTVGANNAAVSATLLYTGGGETSDKAIYLAGFDANSTSIVDASGTGLLKLTGGLTGTDGSKTVTLQGSGAGELAGAVTDFSTGVLSLTKTGAGSWTLSGVNAYTGTTTISGGTLKNGSAASFQGSNTLLTMSGAGTFDLGGFNASIGNLAAMAATNTITNSGATNATLSLVNAGSVSLAGLFTDGPTNKLAISLSNANATMQFTNSSNTFSGGLTLLNSPTGSRLYINSALAFTGSPGALTAGNIGTGTITIGQTATDKAGIRFETAASGTLANAIVFNTALGTDFAGISSSVVAGVTLSGAITANSNAAFTTTGATANLTVAGSIGGVGGVVIAGAGTITFSGTNNYTGGTTLNTGKLVLSSVDALGTAGSINFGGGTLQYTASNTADYSARIASGTGASAVSIDTNGQTVPFATALNANQAGLTKLGAGTLVLSAANSFSGATTISAGVLQLNHANALQNSSATIGVANGLAFNADVGTFNLGGLAGSAAQTLTDTNSNAVTLSVGSNNANTTYTGVLSGAGGIVKVGSGALNLNAVNTNSGPTVINAGTVNLAAASTPTSLASSDVVVNAGGSFVAGGDSDTSGASFTLAKGVTLNSGTVLMNIAFRGETANFTNNLTLASGSSVFAVNGATSGVFGNQAIFGGTLTRSAGATVLFRGKTLGGNTAVNTNATGAPQNIRFTTAPANIGGAGALSTTTTSIIPYAIGDSGYLSGTFYLTSGLGTDFVSYNPTGGTGAGVQLLTTYAASITSGATALENVKVTDASIAGIDAATTINSLILNTAAASAGSPGNSGIDGTGRLTLNSGAILVTTTSAAASNGGTAGNYGGLFQNNATIGANGLTLDFGSAEAIITTVGTSTLTLASGSGGLSGTGGLTKAGAGDLTLNAAGTISGNAIFNGGRIVLGHSLALQNATLNYNNQGGALSFGSLTSVTLAGLTGSQNLALTNDSAGSVTMSVGNNDVSSTYTGTLSGGGSLVKTGSGTFTLTRTNSYTGGTVVAAGTLLLAGGSLTNTAVAVNGGATLAATGMTGNAIGGLVTVAGSIAASGQGKIDLTGDSAAATVLNLTGGLTLGGSNPGDVAQLYFDLNGSGNSADLINLGSGLLTGNPGGAVINIGTASLNNATYTLLTYGSGTGLTPGTNLAVGIKPGTLFTSYTLNVGTNALTLTVGGTPVPNLAYWAGARGGAFNWGDNDGVSSTNWAVNQAGTTDAGQIVGSNTDIVLTAGNATGASLGTQLEMAYSVNSVTVLGSAPASTTAPTIGGAGTLTLKALASGSGSLGYAAGTGLVLNNGAAGLTINTSGGVILGSAQRWTNASASSLVVSSGVTGTGATGNTMTLTLDGGGSGDTQLSGSLGDGAAGGKLGVIVNRTGLGKAVLSGSSTYTGGTSVNAGVLEIQGNSALGNTSGVAVASGAALELQGTAVAIGNFPLTLNGAGLASGPAGALHNVAGANSYAGLVALSSNATIQVDAGTLALTNTGILTGAGLTLTLDGAANGSIASVIGVGSGGITKNGAGTWTLTGTNTYTGTTTINGGKLVIAANTNLGSATVGQAPVLLNGGTLITTAGITNTHAFTIGPNGGTINVTTNGQYFFNTANTLLGSGALALTGAGTLAVGAGNLRVAQTNTFNGNLVLQSGGVFEYGVAGAVGSGATFTLNNQGELAAQGSSAVSLANAITVNGGTNSVLSFENGTLGVYAGPITLNADLTVALRDWYNYGTVRSGTISGVVSGAGGLSVNSGSGTNGTLTLTGANTYTGTTTITSSILRLGNGGTSGSLSPAGTIVTNGALSINRSDAVTQGVDFSSAPLTGTGGVTQAGTGTTTLTLANTYTGTTTVSAGTLAIAGSINSTGGLVAGNTAATAGRLSILAGASVSANNLAIGTNTTATGAVYQGGGSVTLNQAAGSANLAIGAVANGYGYYKLSGGTLVANEIGVGGIFNASTGLMEVTAGGTFNDAGWLTVGRGGSTSSGVLNVVGGTVNLAGTVAGSRFAINWAGAAGARSVVEISAGGTITGPLTGTSYTLDLAAAGNVAGTLGAVNLGSGGTLQIAGITASQANPTSLLNFNGGTLKATVSNANFMTSSNVDGVYVYGGGATIDDNGAAVTIANPILAPTGSGVMANGLTVSGSGYLGAPLVQITGGGGTGATAIATIDASGNLTGITITNPGVDYTSAPTFTLVGGGGTGTVTGAALLAVNIAGNVSKMGAGTLTLSGANTYSGTVITAGTILAASDTALGAGLITLNGGALGASGSPILGNNLQINDVDGNGFTTASDLTISGNLIGSGAVAKSGGASLFLGGNNSAFAGKFSMTAGFIQFAAANAGSGSALWDVGLNATLTSNVAGSNTIALGGLSGEGVVGNNTGVGSLTLLIGGKNGHATFSGSIKDDIFDFDADPVEVIKTGTGTQTFAGIDTYTGRTTVTAGTLELRGSLSGSKHLIISGGTLLIGANDNLNPGANLTLSGGILATGGFSEGSLANPGLNTLTLTASSELDFGVGSGSQLFFAGLGTHAAGARLDINNWSGTPLQLGGSADDRLIFAGADLAAFTSLYNQADVSFNGVFGYTALPLGDQQHFEVVAVPEPSSAALLGIAALAGLAVWRKRRRCSAPQKRCG